MKTISIVIPAKDEQERLPGFLRVVIDYCRQSANRYEIIVVDDGSQDQTAARALSFQKEFQPLKVVRLSRNHGKGFAVKEGFFAAKGEIVLFLDADGSTLPDEIERHLGFFDEGYDMVIGSRAISDAHSSVETVFYRKWMGMVFNYLVSALLIKGIRDTQCGFKMFRASIVPALFGRLYLEGFGFDLELLHLAQKMGLRIKEVAVNWKHVEGSKVDLVKDSLGMFWNILQIRNWHFMTINTQARHMSVKEVDNMYAQEKEHWWFRAKGEFFKALLSKYDLNGHMILDAGCGTGHNLEFLRMSGYYVGCDVVPESLEYCRRNGVDRLIQADLENLAFHRKSFDVIISLDVLEHVADDIKVMAEFKRVLKEDGLLVLAVPAFRFLWSPHDESLSHMRRYNKRDFMTLVEDSGFKIERCGYMYALIFFPVVVFRMFRKLWVKSDQCDTFTNPSPGINRWIFSLLQWESKHILGKSWPFGTSLYIIARPSSR